MFHWKQIKHRKDANSSKTLLMITLNSGRVDPLPSSVYRSYKRIPQSKSMHILPRGILKLTYLVTLSLEYPKAPFNLDSSSVVRSLIGLFVFKSNPVSKVYQHRSNNGGILEVT